MSDTSTQDGNRRRRRRGGRNRPGGNQSSHSSGGGGGGSSSGGSGGYIRSSTPRAGVQKPTGFQKFLSAISFGLLGKPQTLPRPAVRTVTTTSSPGSAGSPRGDSGPRNDAGRPPREPRPPRREPAAVNPADITTDRLYVGNLSYDASESDLFELFNGVGTVRNAEVVVNNRTQRSKGFAFVTMVRREDALKALKGLHGHGYDHLILQLDWAKPPAERPAQPDRPAIARR